MAKYKCTKCGAIVDVCPRPKIPGIEDLNFCPNCVRDLPEIGQIEDLKKICTLVKIEEQVL